MSFHLFNYHPLTMRIVFLFYLSCFLIVCSFFVYFFNYYSFRIFEKEVIINDITVASSWVISIYALKALKKFKDNHHFIQDFYTFQDFGGCQRNYVILYTLIIMIYKYYIKWIIKVHVSTQKVGAYYSCANEVQPQIHIYNR